MKSDVFTTWCWYALLEKALIFIGKYCLVLSYSLVLTQFLSEGGLANLRAVSERIPPSLPTHLLTIFN